MPHPFDQSRYQVRFERGAEGLDRLAAADVVVVVDVLRFATTVTDAVASGTSFALDDAAHSESVNGAGVAAHAAAATHAAASGAVVLLGCLRNAAAVADAILAEQHRRGARTSIAVIAAGELDSRGDGARLRVAVEDDLGAGAVIDALADRGIDHTSPEAAAVCEAFRGLRPAVRHLLTAAGSGQELLEQGLAAEVRAAAEIDATDAVPVLRGGAFERY